MSAPNQQIDFAETQKVAANLIASTFCNRGAEAFLEAQFNLLKGVETALAQWLQRRHDSIEASYKLMARLRDSRDVKDIWKAQQDWAAGALQRLAADVSSYPAPFGASAPRASEAMKTAGLEESARDTRENVPETPKRAVEAPAKPIAAKAVRAPDEIAKVP